MKLRLQKTWSSLGVRLALIVVAPTMLAQEAVPAPEPEPAPAYCQALDGNLVPCDQEPGIQTFLDVCLDAEGNDVCGPRDFTAAMGQPWQPVPTPSPIPTPYPSPYPSPAPSPSPYPYPSPYPSPAPSPVPPPPPGPPQQQWYCTLDSRPNQRTDWAYWKQDRWQVTGPLGGVWIDVGLGDQLAGLACVVRPNGACEITSFGFSSASTCWAAGLLKCECDNAITSGFNQPAGKTIAETKCAYSTVVGGNASARVVVRGQGINVNLNWATAGGVFSNGGQLLDSCSWKQLPAPPVSPPPPAQRGTPNINR